MIDDDYPLGRMGKPEEVAYVVSFLCSDIFISKWLTNCCGWWTDEIILKFNEIEKC